MIGKNSIKTMRTQKEFETQKEFGEYNDLYVQSDKLLLENAFKNFGNMCHEKYGLDRRS